MDIDAPSTNIVQTTTSLPTTQTDISYKRHDGALGIPFAIGMIFLGIALFMIIITVIYFLFWRPVPPSPSCETNINCSSGQICQLGVCVEISCSSNSDCPNNTSCIQSYCYPLTCNIGNDCPTGTACISGFCVNTGTSCTSNADCFQLTCMNTVCVQCLSNSDCPTGQGCFNQSCRYPYDGETGPNMITYFSPAQNNGNIAAPPGYFCSSTNCGIGGQSQPIYCAGSSGTCPGSCQYCVNDYCRCTQGQLYEGCQVNTDCISGLCSETEWGNICVPTGGDCAFNYNGTGCQGCCTVSSPYCINGKCSNVSLGAMCGGSGVPPDMCNNPLSLGAVGTTGITNNGMGFFCVNGTCQSTPGSLNTLCSGGSCSFIQNGALVCTPVTTPSINQMRCLVTT